MGKRIAKARRFRRWSQSRMARELGVVVQTIKLWENGWTQPSLRHLLILRQSLRRTLDWLVCGERHGPWR